MTQHSVSSIIHTLEAHASAASLLRHDLALVCALEAAARACIDCYEQGGKLLLAGNGGSAAQAQHVACELVGRFAFIRPGLAAIALSTDTSVLTAVGNDMGFESVFARQVEALGRAGDVFIAYSTSGSSENIIRALHAARERGMVRIGMSGAGGGEMGALCDHLLCIPATDTPRVQEGHLVLGHALCACIESNLFPGNR